MEHEHPESPLLVRNGDNNDNYKSPPSTGQSINQPQINFMLGEPKLGFSKNFEVQLEEQARVLEETLKLDPKSVDRQQEFIQPWYPAGEKSRKTKLGSLYECSLEDRSDLVCRVVNCKRIAEYQIDAYFTQLAKYKLLKLTNFVCYPIGVCLDEQSGFLTIVETKKLSLFEAIQNKQSEMNPTVKRSILLKIAKTMNTLHG